MYMLYSCEMQFMTLKTVSFRRLFGAIYFCKVLFINIIVIYCVKYGLQGNWWFRFDQIIINEPYSKYIRFFPACPKFNLLFRGKCVVKSYIFLKTDSKQYGAQIMLHLQTISTRFTHRQKIIGSHAVRQVSLILY